MKILLIDPCIEANNKDKGRGVTRFPQISMLYIAALTPEEHEVSIVEEEVRPIDFDAPCDLVGITCMTAAAPRAYRIADEFRRRGRRVVLGGVHPTVRPEEARLHADAVVVGEAEPVWAGLLADAENGRMQPFYRSSTDWSLDDYPLPKRGGRSGAVLHLAPVVTSRGCPYACEFCCVRNVYGRKVRHVSVRRVMEDIEHAGSRQVMFLDDNIVGDPAYAEELFDALKGSGIRWVGQASIAFMNRERLLQKAAAAGCKGLFFGLETVSEERLERMKKGMKTLDETAAAVKRITKAGILFHASIVFGFDEDGPDIFDRTLEFLNRSDIASATFNILTPYPGTVLHDRYKAEGRLLTEDWKDYDHCTPTFTPRLMTVDQLMEGRRRVRKGFNSLRGIASRFPGNWRTPVLFLLANLGQRAALTAEERTGKPKLLEQLAMRKREAL